MTPARYNAPIDTCSTPPQTTIRIEGGMITASTAETAVIAIDKGFPVGAAWYRLFDNDRPGYGFVDERTPELAIAVVPNARGKGVGTALLEALLRDARAAGYPTISLSVDRANAGAIELYGRHGFEQVAEDEDSVTMLAQLDTSTSQPTNEGTETA